MRTLEQIYYDIEKENKMVVLTKISDHGKTSSGSKKPDGGTFGRTQIGWSEWTLCWGEGQNRKSKTLHCDEKTAEYEKSLLKGQE